jgi:hypothetical protein
VRRRSCIKQDKLEDQVFHVQGVDESYYVWIVGVDYTYDQLLQAKAVRKMATLR